VYAEKIGNPEEDKEENISLIMKPQWHKI